MSNNVNKSLSDIDGKLLAASKRSNGLNGNFDSRKDSRLLSRQNKNPGSFKMANSTLESGRPGQVTELLIAAQERKNL